MGQWEAKLLQQAKVQPLLYVRYVDDIFGLWDSREGEIEEFHILANSIDESIEVDLRTSDKSLEFLDVMVMIENGNINTTIYAPPSNNKECHCTWIGSEGKKNMFPNE